MDIETLTTLIPLLTAAGDNAFWIAIFFVGSSYMESFLGFTGFMVFLYFVHRVIKDLIKANM